MFVFKDMHLARCASLSTEWKGRVHTDVNMQALLKVQLFVNLCRTYAGSIPVTVVLVGG